MALPLEIKLTERKLIKHLTLFIINCDVGELIHLAKAAFGGDFEWSEKDTCDIVKNPSQEPIYTFKPNAQYGGEFGEMDW